MIVNYKKAGVMNADGVILKPGVNSVDVHAWKKSRQHPMVQKLIDIGEIVEETEYDTQEKLSQKEDKLSDESILSGMKIPQAKSLVEETVDLELLKSWKVTEKRNQVIGSINAQIEKLEAAPEERDRNASRQVSAGVSVKETYVKNPEDGKGEE